MGRVSGSLEEMVHENSLRALFFAAIICLGTMVPGEGVANSYVDMITTPPAGYAEEISQPYESQAVGAESAKVILQTADGKYIPVEPDYYPAGKTISPVVTPEYHKYLAWREAQANGDAYDEVHEGVQRLLYFFGGAAVARLAYDIWGPYHTNHWLGD